MEPPTGLYEVSADLFGLPHAESFTGLDRAPTPPPSGTIRSMQCASWGPQGALRGTNGVSAEIVVTLGCEILIGYHLGPRLAAPGTKRCRLCASWSPWGHLLGHMGYMIWAASMGLSDSEYLLDYSPLHVTCKLCTSHASPYISSNIDHSKLFS